MTAKLEDTANGAPDAQVRANVERLAALVDPRFDADDRDETEEERA